VGELCEAGETPPLLAWRDSGEYNVVGRNDCGVARSGVAQWQSSRLLTDWLWVRVPPPEYFLQQPRL
jgi:hypothetical protein